MTIQEAQQRLELGVLIELFTLDLTEKGAGVLYWTPSRTDVDKPIIWQGNAYTAIDVMAEGFEKSTSGTLPRPRLTVGNADNIVGSLMALYDDLRGCPITRMRTLYEFLDDQPGADPTAMWPVDIFRVERKVSQNKKQIIVELAAATDQAGLRLPRRVVLRDTCTQVYRRWTGTAFDYTKATCPYTGTACYNEVGNVCSSSSDRCGKRVSDCKLRFGATAELPTASFPGVARVRL